MKSIYIIGSLRNPNVPHLASFLRDHGFPTFDDWHASGPTADECLWAYEKLRGRPYDAALKGYAAQNQFHFDKRHIEEADIGVLMMPAGKSGHLELGVMIGMGKPVFILMDKEPERLDLMHNYATGVVFDKHDLVRRLKEVA